MHSDIVLILIIVVILIILILILIILILIKIWVENGLNIFVYSLRVRVIYYSLGLLHYAFFNIFSIAAYIFYVLIFFIKCYELRLVALLVCLDCLTLLPDLLFKLVVLNIPSLFTQHLYFFSILSCFQAQLFCKYLLYILFVIYVFMKPKRSWLNFIQICCL